MVDDFRLDREFHRLSPVHKKGNGQSRRHRHDHRGTGVDDHGPQLMIPDKENEQGNQQRKPDKKRHHPINHIVSTPSL